MWFSLHGCRSPPHTKRYDVRKECDNTIILTLFSRATTGTRTLYQQGSVTSSRNIDRITLSAIKSRKVESANFHLESVESVQNNEIVRDPRGWGAKGGEIRWSMSGYHDRETRRKKTKLRKSFSVSRPYFTICIRTLVFTTYVRIFHDGQHRVFAVIIYIVIVVVVIVVVFAAVAVIIAAIQHSASNGPSAQHKRLLFYYSIFIHLCLWRDFFRAKYTRTDHQS